MTLAEVVGHERQRALLGKALANRSVGPAILFFGPSGVGKMKTACELARALLCHAGGEDACGACPSCRLLEGGAHPDFRIVSPEEKKKRIRVEQVREAQGFLSLTASTDRGKVVIVEPADALTVESANALLKTLEEPPPGTLIVLVCTNLGGLPPTVISRCRKVSFGYLEDDSVALVLRQQGWSDEDSAGGVPVAEGSPGNLISQRDEAWKRAGTALQKFLEAVAERRNDRILELVEGLKGDRREGDHLVHLLLGKVRREVRRRLGVGAAPPGAGEVPLNGLSDGQLHQLASSLVETARLLAGNVNVKLALGGLFGQWVRERPPGRMTVGPGAPGPQGPTGETRGQRDD